MVRTARATEWRLCKEIACGGLHPNMQNGVEDLRWGRVYSGAGNAQGRCIWRSCSTNLVDPPRAPFFDPERQKGAGAESFVCGSKDNGPGTFSLSPDESAGARHERHRD